MEPVSDCSNDGARQIAPLSAALGRSSLRPFRHNAEASAVRELLASSSFTAPAAVWGRLAFDEFFEAL